MAVPDLQGLPSCETFRVDAANEEHLGIDEYDVANQGLVSHYYFRAEMEG